MLASQRGGNECIENDDSDCSLAILYGGQLKPQLIVDALI